MAFDAKLAERVRSHLGGVEGVVEKKMFGGIAFLVHGNMSVGVHAGELIVRIGPAVIDKALHEPGARIFDITGRPMKGWLLVDASALADNRSLAKWIDRGVAFARSLPRK